MNIQEQEERDFTHSTATDWDNAEARELGELHPDQEWILTDRDVWHKNPNYMGEPGPHPEDDTRDLDFTADPPREQPVPDWGYPDDIPRD